MSEEFVIENGVLKKYTGKGGDIVIPEGVTGISYGAFPYSWRMEETEQITSITLPNSLCDIGYKAFSHCDMVKEFIIENNPKYFTRDGVLYERLNDRDISLIYYPPGREGDFTLPEDIVQVDPVAFEGSKLSRLLISKEVKVLPRKSGLPYITDIVFEENYAQTKEKILADYVDDIQINSETDCAYIAIYQTGKKWAEKVTAYMGSGTDNTNAVIREMVRLLKEETDEKVIVNSIQPVIAAIEVVDHELFKSFYDVVYEKQTVKAIKQLIENSKVQSILLGELGVTEDGQDNINPVELEVKSLWKINNTTKKLADIIINGIRYKDSDEKCSDQVLKYVIAEYAEELDGRERFVSEYKAGFVNTAFKEDADRIAATLNQGDLQEVLESIALTEKHWKDGYLIPFARFASPEQISKLVADMNKWESGGPRGRTAIIIARGGLMLSDTREAMMAVDKTGGLSYYASLRDKDPDVLRDTMLSNFGFNEKGEKIYDLGGNKVTVQVNDELQLTLYDNNAGKSVKSLPKKNAEQTLYDTAKADFADLKKNIRKVYTNRKKILFRAFLSSKEFAPEYWEEFYQDNPVLAAIARLLVWQQEDHFFTLSQGKTVDYEEQDYSLDNQKQIRLAYPTEMSAEEITGWQNYFVKKESIYGL